MAAEAWDIGSFCLIREVNKADVVLVSNYS